MICSPISCNLPGGRARQLAASAARRFTSSGLAIRVACWGVSLSGDCCSAERRRPGSRAWTCCSRCCQVSSLRWKIQAGHNFRFKLMNSYPSLAHIQSFSPSWPLGSCRLAAFCAQNWVSDSHTGLPRSPPGRLGFTVIHCQSCSG